MEISPSLVLVVSLVTLVNSVIIIIVTNLFVNRRTQSCVSFYISFRCLSLTTVTTINKKKEAKKGRFSSFFASKRGFCPRFSLLVVIKNIYETYRYYNFITYSSINKLIFCENGVLKSRILFTYVCFTRMHS